MRNYFLFVNAKCVADYTHKGNAEKAFHKYCEEYHDTEGLDIIKRAGVELKKILTRSSAL